MSSYCYEPSRTLIDPKVPSEGLGWFAGRKPRPIVLTNGHHYRHSGHFQEAFGCPVVSCHHAGLCELAGGQEEEVVEGLSFGEEVR